MASHRGSTQINLPQAVVHWPNLPNEAWVDVKVLMALLQRSRASIYRDEATGRIPAGRLFSPGCKRWNVGAIRRVLSGDACE